MRPSCPSCSNRAPEGYDGGDDCPVCGTPLSPRSSRPKPVVTPTGDEDDEETETETETEPRDDRPIKSSPFTGRER